MILSQQHIGTLLSWNGFSTFLLNRRMHTTHTRTFNIRAFAHISTQLTMESCVWSEALKLLIWSLLLFRENRPISGFGEKRLLHYHHPFCYRSLSHSLAPYIYLFWESESNVLLVSGIIDGAFACKPRFFGIKNETDVIRLFEMDTNHDGNKVLLEENKVISLKRTENSFYLLVVLTQCACGMLFPFHIYWIHSDCVWHESVGWGEVFEEKKLTMRLSLMQRTTTED